ncbi:hypothetical protein ABL78_0516 [Leptomonas seymouri]|uniref:Uncharacterized protein n=1 Tax=Leptomonas seymouri TaxID=5684 RepID=A0A0N1I3F1_LEPSE|nr:hypothetical protein ABL78_0516 [Leptomonas seymouri]|eukprot:KPI90290.1 hypothetical protein ABL78_0516 [Leptomonas seymouri]
MSSGFTAPSPPATCVSLSELASSKKLCHANNLMAAVDLTEAFYDARMQLHRTHEGMRQLMSRCQAFGKAVEHCSQALIGLSTFADAPSISPDKSDASAAAASAAVTASYRHLHWSLSEFHTHMAQLLSAASRQAYDAAVMGKISSRLILMERGAAMFQHSVARTQQPVCNAVDGAAVTQGCALQLKQLACTRFVPAYESFLLYAVAMLGDFSMLWGTAAQKCVEEMMWSSVQEGQATMAAPLHSVTALTTTANASLSKKHLSSSPALRKYSGAAIVAVEELRDAVFHYVFLLHGAIHQFSVAATTLAKVLAAVHPDTTADVLGSCIQGISELDTILTNSHSRMTTRRCCYEALVADGVLGPLHQMHDDSINGVSLHGFVGAVNYSFISKTSTALGRALRRLRDPRRKECCSYRNRQSTLDAHVPSSPLETLLDVWHKMSELCAQVGTEVSGEFTKRVKI